jgi:hypothetical protein
MSIFELIVKANGEQGCEQVLLSDLDLSHPNLVILVVLSVDHPRLFLDELDALLLVGPWLALRMLLPEKCYVLQKINIGSVGELDWSISENQAIFKCILSQRIELYRVLAGELLASTVLV